MATPFLESQNLTVLFGMLITALVWTNRQEGESNKRLRKNEAGASNGKLQPKSEKRSRT